MHNWIGCKKQWSLFQKQGRYTGSQVDQAEVQNQQAKRENPKRQARVSKTNKTVTVK